MKYQRGFAPLLALAVWSAIQAGGWAQQASSGSGSTGSSQKLDTVTVTDTGATSADVAQANLNNVAGGTALIRNDDVSGQNFGNLADLFRYQPGVYAEAAGGTGLSRISIRGSGLTTNHQYFKNGVQILFDGLPVTGSSMTSYDLVNNQDSAYTEVLKGSNGLVYGSRNLGGSINFVTHTGYDSYRYQARFDAGSFGYYSGQVSSGGVEGNTDYYASVTGFTSQGYVSQSEAKAGRVTADIGYKLNDDVDTRFYVRAGYTYIQDLQGVTWQQLKAGVRQVPASNADVSGYHSRQSPPLWLANKTTIKLDPDSELTLGETYNHYSSPNPDIHGSARFFFDDVSFDPTYKRSDLILDHQSETTVSANYIRHLNAGDKVSFGDGTIGGEDTNLVASTDQTGSEIVNLVLSNDLETVKDVWLTNNITGLYTHNIDKVSPGPANGNFGGITAGTLDYNDFDYQGRIGLRWDVNKNSQVYGNFSRSVAPPPDFFQSQGFSSLTPRLKNQTAETAEIGTRYEEGIFKASASLYHSEVDNELLTVHLPGTPASSSTTSNATPTIHQGVELSLDTVLWQEAKAPKTTLGKNSSDPKDVKSVWQQAADEPGLPHRVTLQQAYTYSDFYYSNEGAYHNNHLPGVPEHLYQAELLYEHPTGFYIGPNTEISSAIWADYANSLKTTPYALLGLRLGYKDPKGHWDTYLQFKNLTNVRYASEVTPTYNAAGTDTTVFYPGDGFGVYGGFGVHF